MGMINRIPRGWSIDPADYLVCWLESDDDVSGGGTWEDKTSNGNDATLQNVCSVTTGEGCYIPGDNGGRVTIPHDSTLDPGDSDFCLSFWVKTSLGTGSNIGMCGYGDRADDAGITCYLPSSDYKAYWFVDDGTNLEGQQPSATINDGDWHHVCLVIDRTAARATAYTDATSTSSDSISGFGTLTTADSHDDWDFGMMWNNGTWYTNKFVGYIDDVRFYKGLALTAAMVQDIYDDGDHAP